MSSTSVEAVSPTREFNVQAAHGVVRDLLRPKIAIYWTDFLVSMAVAVAAFLAVSRAGWVAGGAVAMVLYLVSVVALFRASMFIHELTHFQSRAGFGSLRIGWNVLCGIPMMIPLFMYTCHGEHHNNRHYGTPGDAEYLPFARMSPWRIVGIVAASPIVPLLGPYRFGVLTPLSWVVPRLRRYTYLQASALKLDLDYVGRPPRDRRERLSWGAQELGCFAVLGTVTVLTTTGVLPVEYLLQWYLTALGVVLLNTARLFGAHRYHGSDEGMSLLEQMADTVNVARRRPIAELWGPVGLRLHALHHLLPGLPYHNYAVAHDRLISAFGPHSPYAATLCPGLLVAVRRLWRESRAWSQAVGR